MQQPTASWFVRVLTSLAFVVALASVGLSASAMASEERAPCGQGLNFYSDPGLQNLVGQVAYTPAECGCIRSEWGDTNAPYADGILTSCIDP